MTTLPHAADMELLGLELDADPRHGRFELVPALSRPDGALYGGTAIAASIAAMEAATGRHAVWVTTQFVAQATIGQVIECTTDVLALGRRIAQVQVTGRLGDKVVFTSLGSTAEPRLGGLEGQYQAMPAVGPPEESESTPFGPRALPGTPGFTGQIEHRQARRIGPEDPEGPVELWSRLLGGRAVTPATIAFLADIVPAAIARAAGLLRDEPGPFGPSLDNSLRFGRLPPDQEWLLLELRGQMAFGGSAHGSVSVWTPAGDLVAVGGQSANMVRPGDSATTGRPKPPGARGS
jgi:acyl-CoA thioesterase II